MRVCLLRGKDLPVQTPEEKIVPDPFATNSPSTKQAIWGGVGSCCFQMLLFSGVMLRLRFDQRKGAYG